MRFALSLLSSLILAAEASAEPPSFTRDGKPLFTEYCTRCHNAKKQEGGIDLASIVDDVAANTRQTLWKRALARVAAGEMPPEDAKQPTAADRQKLAKWLGAAAEYLDCDVSRRDPGPPLLRRLTHTEYVQTVEDLLGVHLDPRNDLGFPAEEPSDGRFENLSAALRTSPALLEKYFAAADKIADTVFANDGARRRLMNPPPGPKLTESDAAKEILTNLLRRAYRRPAATADVNRMVGFYDTARAKGGAHEDGIRACLKPVLVSPSFLFRVEADRAAAGTSPGVPVDDFELATRLSYFLWGTMPDEQLHRAAAEKKLSDPANFEKELARLLKHDRTRHLTESLANDWLMMRRFPKARPTVEFFPTFNDDLKRPMAQEVRMMLDHIRTADRPITDLLDADYTFVNKALAAHYGIADVTGDQLRKVSLKPEHHRGGLLGMGGVLAMTSHTFRTSPTQRGKYVLEVIFGTPPPPPPANAGTIKNDDPKKRQPLTFREQLAEHAVQPSCAGCHRKIDPLGFAMDNFNAIGSWRESTKEVPLDVSGVLPGGEKVDGFAGLKLVLLKKKDEFAANMVAKTLEFALGRELDGQDECTVREVTNSLKNHEYRFSVLVSEIARSVPFRQRRAVQK